MTRPSADDGKPRPILWPALKPEETRKEWASLREWVEQLRIRFPNALRLPDCWWRHNDLVEALSALRDFERACYATGGPATGPVEWHRAFRDIEWRLEVWVKKLTCSVAGRGHDVPTLPNGVPDGWEAFVAADADRRRATTPPAQPPASDRDHVEPAESPDTVRRGALHELYPRRDGYQVDDTANREDRT